MKKKAAIIMTVLCAASVFFTGCAGKSEGEAQTVADDGQDDEHLAIDSGGNAELRFWCDEEEMELFQEQIDAFVSEHKSEANITVECEAVAASECKDVFLADVNHGADVFCLPDDQLLTMTSSGVLEEITGADAVAAANLEGAVEAASVGGKMFAYPITADNGYFLFYDRDYFTQEDVKKLDRILEVCEENDRKFLMDWSSGWYLYSFFGNTGMTFGLNEDGLTNSCDWNRTEGEITGVDVAKAMLSIAKSPAFLSESDFAAALADGSVIAIVSGVWDMASVRKAFGDDYGACRLPSYTCAGRQVQMASFTGYRLLGVNSYSKNKAWAEKLAEYLTSEESQKYRFERAERGPSNKNAAASEEVQNNPAILAVLEQSEFGVLQKAGQKYWAPATKYGNTLAAGNPGNIPLQDLLDEMVSGITE